MLLICASVEVVVLTWVQYINYLAFVPTQGDLGSYNQAFFTTTRFEGFFYYTTNIPGGSGGSLWAVHFSPTLLVLVPLYAVWSSPVALIAFKQLAIAFACVPLFGLARIYFRGDRVPLIFGLLYLVSPFTLGANWNNFDPESLVPIAVITSLYFFAKGRFWPFLVCWILALGAIEAAPPILILFGLGGLIGSFLALSHGPYWTSAQQRKPLLVAMILSAGWLGLAAFELFEVGPRGGAFGVAYASRYTVLGAKSFPDVIPQVVLHPKLALAALQYQGLRKVIFLALLLVGTGTLWIIGGFRYLLPVAGYVTLAVLSNDTQLYAIGSQYPALVLGFAWVGAIEGAVVLRDRMSRADPSWRHALLKRQVGDRLSALLARLRESSGGSRTRMVCADTLEAGIGELAADRLSAAESAAERAERILSLSGARAAVDPGVAGTHDVPDAQHGKSRPWSAARQAVSSALSPGPARLFTAMLTVVAVAVLATTAVSNPLLDQPVGSEPSGTWGVPSVSESESILQSTLNFVPARASVFTIPHIFPEVSSRYDAYTVPQAPHLTGGETLAEDYGNYVNLSDYVVVDYPVSAKASEILMMESNLSGFGLLASDGGALVFERGWTGPIEAWAPWIDSIPGGSLNPHGEVVSEKYGSAQSPTLYHPAGGANGTTLWAGPATLQLPLGMYVVTFDLELLAPQPGDQLRLSVSTNPAVVNPDPSLTFGDYVWYQPEIATENTNFTKVNSTLVTTAGSSTAFDPVSYSISFTLNQTSYVEFPGVELSAQMSVYLVSINIQEVAPLP